MLHEWMNLGRVELQPSTPPKTLNCWEWFLGAVVFVFWLIVCIPFRLAQLLLVYVGRPMAKGLGAHLLGKGHYSNLWLAASDADAFISTDAQDMLRQILVPEVRQCWIEALNVIIIVSGLLTTSTYQAVYSGYGNGAESNMTSTAVLSNQSYFRATNSVSFLASVVTIFVAALVLFALLKYAPLPDQQPPVVLTVESQALLYFGYQVSVYAFFCSLTTALLAVGFAAYGMLQNEHTDSADTAVVWAFLAVCVLLVLAGALVTAVQQDKSVAEQQLQQQQQQPQQQAATTNPAVAAAAEGAAKAAASYSSGAAVLDIRPAETGMDVRAAAAAGAAEAVAAVLSAAAAAAAAVPISEQQLASMQVLLANTAKIQHALHVLLVKHGELLTALKLSGGSAAGTGMPDALEKRQAVGRRAGSGPLAPDTPAASIGDTHASSSSSFDTNPVSRFPRGAGGDWPFVNASSESLIWSSRLATGIRKPLPEFSVHGAKLLGPLLELSFGSGAPKEAGAPAAAAPLHRASAPLQSLGTPDVEEGLPTGTPDIPVEGAPPSAQRPALPAPAADVLAADASPGSPRASCTTTLRLPQGSTVQQEWDICISSSGTGAIDEDDDGRRLSLTLLDKVGNELFSGSTDASSPWQAPTIDYSTKSWSRAGRVTVQVPEGATPAVLMLQKQNNNGKPALDYIASVTIDTRRPNARPTTFVAERWLSSAEVPSSADWPWLQPVLVLFAATSLPQDDTPFLQHLRSEELDKIRGKYMKPGILNAQRVGADQIYDYQTYNDLGTQKNPRPTLGGSKWPYPRRLSTHKQTDLDGQIEPNSSDPWLPFDERFNFTKSTDFTAGLVSAAVPAAFVLLHKLLDSVLGGKVTSYTSFAELAKRFDVDIAPSPLSPALSSVPDPAPVVASVPATGGHSLGADLKEWFAGHKNKVISESPFEDASEEAAADKATPAAARPMTVGDAPPTANKAKVAVSTLLSKAWEAVFGRSGTDFTMPRVLKDRPANVVLEDEEFGRQVLAGFNPSAIQALKKMPADFGSAITEDDVAGELGSETLQSLVAAAQAGQQPRLFLVDHWDPYAHFFTEEWTEKNRVLHAGRALLYLQKDAAGKDTALVPIAIELAAHPNAHNEPTASTPPTQGTVFSRSKLLKSKSENVWQLAKLIFRSTDVGLHQLISHWLRCHCAIEPFLIALKRNLSTAHPVYKLMLPHFRYTMAINAAARGNLVNAGGIIERTFAPGPYSMRLSSLVYGKSWRFKSQALPVDLLERGMVDASGKPFLDYPYADDGMAIWRSMEKYFGDYLEHYYGSGSEGDAKVAADPELQGWWDDVTTKAHPDLPLEQWGLQDPAKISSRSELVRILVTIAWTASAHHAAVNFGQYDNTSYPLNTPTIVRKAVPRNESEWEGLAAADHKGFERQVLDFINDTGTNLLVAITVSLLSTHSHDEQLLDEENKLLVDAKAKELNAAFVADMKALEAEIINKHKQGSWTRCIPGTPGLKGSYSTCLIPGSAPGLTMRGVPYSVSI